MADAARGPIKTGAVCAAFERPPSLVHVVLGPTNGGKQ
jgi:hypothetical protein